MNLRRLRSIILIILTIFSATFSEAGELLYGISAQDPDSGRLFTIDSETGQVQFLGPSGMGLNLSLTLGLAARPSDGVLFMHANDNNYRGLHRLDKNTGLATLIGINTLLSGVAFDSASNLYTQIASSSVNATGPIGLVNTNTGQATSLGGQIFPRLFGLSFNPADSLLYGITTLGEKLYRIRLDGTLHSSKTLSGSVGVIGDITFTKQGKLIASNLNSQLFEINPTSGAFSNFLNIPGGQKPQGLTKVLTIPEPTTLSLTTLVLIPVAMRRRRRSSSSPTSM